jgi:hypothetical protein
VCRCYEQLGTNKGKGSKEDIIWRSRSSHLRDEKVNFSIILKTRSKTMVL